MSGSEPAGVREWVAALSIVACLWAAAWAAASGALPVRVALFVALAFLPYAFLLASPARFARRELVVFAIAAALPAIAAPSALSDDLYRYLWDARVLGHGLDPYRYAPSSPALAHLRDELWLHVNHPDIPTIYPPVAQLLFLCADQVAHAPWSMKLLAVVGHLALIPMVGALGRRAGVSGAQGGWALNPLALSESALGGHADVFVGLTVAACVLSMVTRRPWHAAIAAALAGGIKLVGLLVAPLIGSRDRGAALFAFALAFLAVLPLAGAGDRDTVGGLGQYARRWQGNAGPYALVQAGVEAGLQSAFGTEPGRVKLPALRAVFASLDGGVFDPRASFQPEKKPIADPAVFETHVLGALLARMLIFTGVFAAAFWLAHRKGDPLFATRALLFGALLLAPQIHPWYLLWLLPLELAAGRLPGVAWSALVLVAYAPLDGWQTTREWEESLVAPWFEYGGVAVLLFWEFFRQNSKRSSV